jgi:glycosyltransferase involved in cell wall biosynthesis
MDAVLVYSEHTKSDVIEVLGVDADRVHVVPLAAHRRYKPIEDRQKVQDTINKYGIEDRRYVLHVGSLEPRKNLTRLVEAFYELLVEEPALPHKLVFSGPRFSTYHPIFEAIDKLGMTDRVLWLGVIPFDDLPALMNGADVFVYPSVYEGFGLPPLEAMACGTPVIVSRATSLPEVVGDAGLLVDPYRVSEIKTAIKKVVLDPELRSTLSKSGLRRAAQFSWDLTAERTMEVYQHAIAARSIVRIRGDHKRRSTKEPKNQQLVHEWLFNHMQDQISSLLNKQTSTS